MSGLPYKILVIPVLIGTALGQSPQQTCGLSDKEKSRLTSLLQNAYNFAPDINLQFFERDPIPNFRRLTALSVTPGRPFEKDLLITIDSELVLDPVGAIGVSADPADSRHRLDLLNAGRSPHMGIDSAAVTVVMYSDFQCPYCRDGYLLLQRRLGEDKNVRLIFRHHPLANHNWSRPAARTAICMYKQGNDVFWRFSDFLFRRQTDITAENLRTKEAEFIASTTGLDRPELERCEASTTPDRILLEDENSGFFNRVGATPTFFINGIKLVGLGADDTQFLETFNNASRTAKTSAKQ